MSTQLDYDGVTRALELVDEGRGWILRNPALFRRFAWQTVSRSRKGVKTFRRDFDRFMLENCARTDRVFAANHNVFSVVSRYILRYWPEAIIETRKCSVDSVELPPLPREVVG